MQQMEQQKNFLIPEHRKLTDEEVSNILERYQLPTRLKLPKIKVKDPAIKEMEEVQAGDVIEIKRNSFAGDSVYYRVVIE